jgi:hypothetical protein
MRRIVAAETGVSEEEAQQLVAANAADEAKLTTLADLVADGSLEPADYAKATKRLRAAIEERLATIASLQSGTVLDLLGGSVAESWPTLTQTERAALLGQFVKGVHVRRSAAKRGHVRGGGPFNTARVSFDWKYPALAKAAAGLWAEMTDEEREASWERSQATLTDDERYGRAG